MEDKSDGATVLRDVYVSDLTASVQKAVLPTTQHGYANDTLYTKGWAATVPLLCPKSSHVIHTNGSIPWAESRTGMLVRHGTVWNAKLARMCKRPLIFQGPPNRPMSNGLCPACGAPDSTSHIMGGCTHNRMKAAYIHRHNTAVQAIAKTISKGKNGGCYMVMDAGAEANLPDYAASIRPPKWLLPEHPESANELARMRPDILLVPSLASGKTPRRHSDLPPSFWTHKDTPTAYILEIGYTHDTKHEEKAHRKAEQHSRLAERLREAGWKVVYSKLEAITLGFGGTIRGDLASLLQTLGASNLSATKCCDKLSKHAVHTAHATVQLRRELERTTELPPGG